VSQVEAPVSLTLSISGWRRAKHSETPLVPEASIAGRALATIVAIMTFLASLAGGAAILVSDSSRIWQGAAAREITIQVRPSPGRDLEADTARAAELARAMAGIAWVRPYTKAQSEELLEPWLGTGLDLSELPIPRLIAAGLDAEERLDLEVLRKRLAEAIPGSSVDDHHLWIEHLAVMAKSVVIAAGVLFCLVLAAMGLAISFATQGAMAGNREIIEILHFVGAANGYIARQFQRHFFRLGLKGGAIGGAAAIAVFYILQWLAARLRATPGGDQLEAMFGAFSIGGNVYLAIALIAGGVGIITGLVSRVIVYRHLQSLS
jgi:cell division transport system permease protein